MTMRATQVVILIASMIEGCAVHSKDRALAVGGVQVLDGATSCHLTQVEPTTALEDLHWKDALVVRANGEGQAELACGEERTRLRLVKPDRVELVLVEVQAKAGQRFHVRAIARDAGGHELELGKWPDIAWQGDSGVVSDEDASAGEFGLGGGAFGVHGFKATKPGEFAVEARLGAVVGTLRVPVKP
ncbi:MAG TPA: hypothetical protein VFP84_33120 [Kofleriaceae bacterium]|nr:hypothetical protein [Kofleriaceae bacterium]